MAENANTVKITGNVTVIDGKQFDLSKAWIEWLENWANDIVNFAEAITPRDGQCPYVVAEVKGKRMNLYLPDGTIQAMRQERDAVQQPARTAEAWLPTHHVVLALGDRLHLREKPEADSQTVCTVGHHTNVQFLVERDEWTRVRLDDKAVGWIKSVYLEDGAYVLPGKDLAAQLEQIAPVPDGEVPEWLVAATSQDNGAPATAPIYVTGDPEAAFTLSNPIPTPRSTIFVNVRPAHYNGWLAGQSNRPGNDQWFAFEKRLADDSFFAVTYADIDNGSASVLEDDDDDLLLWLNEPDETDDKSLRKSGFPWSRVFWTTLVFLAFAGLAVFVGISAAIALDLIYALAFGALIVIIGIALAFAIWTFTEPQDDTVQPPPHIAPPSLASGTQWKHETRTPLFNTLKDLGAALLVVWLAGSFVAVLYFTHDLWPTSISFLFAQGILVFSADEIFDQRGKSGRWPALLRGMCFVPWIVLGIIVAGKGWGNFYQEPLAAYWQHTVIGLLALALIANLFLVKIKTLVVLILGIAIGYAAHEFFAPEWWQPTVGGIVFLVVGYILKVAAEEWGWRNVFVSLTIVACFIAIVVLGVVYAVSDDGGPVGAFLNFFEGDDSDDSEAAEEQPPAVAPSDPQNGGQQGVQEPAEADEAPPEESEPVAAEMPIVPADTDSDGIPDSADACPKYGDVGFGVAANGCPYYAQP